VQSWTSVVRGDGIRIARSLTEHNRVKCTESYKIEVKNCDVQKYAETRVRQNISPRIFLHFAQQSHGISKRTFNNIFNRPICAHNSRIIIQLAYCVLKLSALQWCHLVMSPCSKTSVRKSIPENRMQNWLYNSCLDFIASEMWPLNSQELNPLDHYFWANVWGLSHSSSKTEDTAEHVIQMAV